MLDPDFSTVEPYGVSHESFARLVVYYHLLLKWQKAINLVSPKTLNEAWQRHFVDSVQFLSALPDSKAATLVDLGSGGGFPGLVWALCRPDLTVHLVDSDMRKCQFLKTVSRESGAAHVHIHTARAEQILPDLQPDYISARGFTALDSILDLADDAYGTARSPVFLLMKGARHEDELAQARGRYSFDADSLPSATNPESCLLRIKNVSKC